MWLIIKFIQKINYVAILREFEYYLEHFDYVIILPDKDSYTKMEHFRRIFRANQRRRDNYEILEESEPSDNRQTRSW